MTISRTHVLIFLALTPVLFSATARPSQAQFVPATAIPSTRPQIEFDIGSVIYWNDATDEVDPFASPFDASMRLIQIPIGVSIDVNRAAQLMLEEIRVEVLLLDDDAVVVDFLPDTTTSTDYDGPIQIESAREQRADANVELGLPIPPVQVGGKVGGGVKDQTTVRSQRLPPQQPLIASGTVGRRRGVFVKYLRSTQVPWEAQREIVLTVAVPPSWRVGLASVNFTATRQRASFPESIKPNVLRHQRYYVPLVAHTDVKASLLAKRFNRHLADAMTMLRQNPSTSPNRDSARSISLNSKPRQSAVDNLSVLEACIVNNQTPQTAGLSPANDTLGRGERKAVEQLFRTQQEFARLNSHSDMSEKVTPPVARSQKSRHQPGSESM